MSETLNEFKKQQAKSLELLGEVQRFLEKGKALGVDVENLQEKVANTTKTVANGKLKIALIGGFSEGKTSIASAWLGKLEKSMNISQQESSNEVKIYNVNNEIELVDTPGLFGFKEKTNADTKKIEQYKEITKKYVSESNLVLYVMNAINPIKESHKEDLEWLFRTLNLLPRTVFVLSRFDEVADVEDEEDYQEKFQIKKNNIIGRLENLIAIDSEEKNDLSIVAVSANPFEMGLKHWLENVAEFENLSHISLLRNETTEKIKKNGGKEQIVNETKKSVIEDVLQKLLPPAKEDVEKLEEKVERLKESLGGISKGLVKTKRNISEVQIHLKEFVVNYFSGLILQVKGTSLETVGKFFEREIGAGGINLNTKIENEFQWQMGVVNIELEKMTTTFQTETKSFGLAMKGLQALSKVKLTNTTVLTGRNAIRSGGKMLGFNLAKSMKFKPWGAVKFAKGLNKAMPFIGIALEVWDSYKEHQKQKEFEKVRDEMVANFERQRKELLEMISDREGFEKKFPNYIEMVKNMKALKNSLTKMEAYQKDFEEWEIMGKAIESKK